MKQSKKKNRFARLRLCALGICILLLFGVGFLVWTDAGQYVRERVVFFLERGDPDRLCPKEYDDTVQMYAARYDVPENILYAVIRTESNFDPEAVSSAGARGLMQLMPETFAWLAGKVGIVLRDAETEIFDPDMNVHCGAYYLRFLYETFGSWMEACAAYNAGQGRVALWLEDSALTDETGRLLPDAIPFSETRRYVEKVQAYYDAYERWYPDGETVDFDSRTFQK